ncbi:unnamed protein product [Cuscuta campestris]|uniref:Uncharacterized protein n=1 Tax=Cuscuta campestris TaxID=132261 RepID=A0A484L6W2_9ASTE|nr:unnamed protein product [Cuscuta campestris]
MELKGQFDSCQVKRLELHKRATLAEQLVGLPKTAGIKFHHVNLPTRESNLTCNAESFARRRWLAFNSPLHMLPPLRIMPAMSFPSSWEKSTWEKIIIQYDIHFLESFPASESFLGDLAIGSFWKGDEERRLSLCSELVPILLPKASPSFILTAPSFPWDFVAAWKKFTEPEVVSKLGEPPAE